MEFTNTEILNAVALRWELDDEQSVANLMDELMDAGTIVKPGFDFAIQVGKWVDAMREEHPELMSEDA